MVQQGQSYELILGVDIGGTKCAVSTSNAEQGIIDRVAFPTDSKRGPAWTLGRIITEGQALIRAKSELPRAVGCSVGAPFDPNVGEIDGHGLLPGWDRVAVVDILQEAFGLPVFADNDANACALAEWKFGAGRGCRHMAFLTFGTGLGAGLILNGELYRGASNMAGEVGAIRVEKNGPPLRGKPGCLEGFASGAGIAMLAEQMHRESTHYTRIPQGASARDVALLAAEGDVLANEVFAECGRKLGLGVSILIDVLNLERIILGSLFVRCESLLRNELESVVARESMSQPAAACRILPAELGESIGDYAALAIALDGLGRATHSR